MGENKRRFVIGDIHGAYRAFKDCLDAVQFNYEHDLLVCLGDVCDGWPETKESIDEMLKMKNLVYILGNHDKWGYSWFLSKAAPDIWTNQGGNATIHSYRDGVPDTHIDFMKRADYYHTFENKIFVHGGFDPGKPIYQQDPEVFLWDRSMLYMAIENHEHGLNGNITSFEEVYVGHTPTIKLGARKPVKFGEIWMLDTGAGWKTGVLSIMDIDTKKFYTSNPVESYYPNWQGRG